MTYLKLKEKLKNYPIFRLEDIFKWFPLENRRTVISQLSGWTNKGLLQRLKRGVYKFSDFQVKDTFILSDLLYSPSYISKESALNYYGIIPDIPFAITSVTTNKSIDFHSKEYGLFIYSHIKPTLFFSYKTIKTDIYNYKIALPEKALFDFIYFKSFERSFSPENFLSEARFSFEKQFHWNFLRKWQKIVPAGQKKFHFALNNLLEKYA